MVGRKLQKKHFENNHVWQTTIKQLAKNDHGWQKTIETHMEDNP